MKEKISIYGILANILLTAAKIVAGVFSGSIALIAEAIHSSLDILSSLVTYIGIRVARRPADEEHPYGYFRSETIASLVVVIILAITGGWVIYEGIMGFLGPQEDVFTVFGLIVIGSASIINYFMARLKLYWGNRENSLPLISDGENSKADVYISVGVFIGLIFVKYFPAADSIIAILVGLYILYDSYELFGTTTSSLLDTRNKKTEESIKSILEEKNIDLENIRSREIGEFVSAEIVVNLPKNITVDEANNRINGLEKELKEAIDRLKHIVITFEAKGESFEESITYGKRGVAQRSRKSGIHPGRAKEAVQAQKESGVEKIIIPIKKEKDEVAEDFGSSRYMVLEIKNKKIINKEIVENPYAEDGIKRGGRFAKDVSATKIITKSIGDTAKSNFESLGIEVKEIPKDTSLNSVLNNITKGGDI